MTLFLAIEAASQAVAPAAGAVRDTLMVRTLTPDRSVVELVFFWASGLTSILALLLLATLVAGLFWMRRAAIAAAHRVDELFDELRPMLDQATETVASVRKTADLMQDEVLLVKEGVHESSERVRKTVGDLADRVDDFNELLGKVHSRADAMATVADAAMDGIAWSAQKLRERKRKRLHRKS